MADACLRCRKTIKGPFKIIDGKKLGPDCFKIIEQRNRIKTLVPNSLEIAEDGSIFTKTDYCSCSCLTCNFLSLEICPLEDSYSGILGRKR